MLFFFSSSSFVTQNAELFQRTQISNKLSRTAFLVKSTKLEPKLILDLDLIFSKHDIHLLTQTSLEPPCNIMYA